jgi:HlyD family secretion protein
LTFIVAESKKKTQLYRQAALDRLSSPEQLDHLVVLASPMGWMATLAIWVILALVVVWSLVGTISEQALGQGILVTKGGQILDAMSPAGGRISEVLVEVDQEVEEGQVIARLRQNALAMGLKGAKAFLLELKGERQSLVEGFTKAQELRQRNVEKQLEAQERRLKAARERVDYLKGALVEREKLAASGVIAQDQLAQLKGDLNSALQDLAAPELRRLEIEEASLRLQAEHDQRLLDLDQGISSAQRKVARMKADLETRGVIRSPAGGRLIELKIFAGQMINTGSSVASIAKGEGALQAVLFIDTRDGKRVKEGMAVRVSPSQVKPEVHGTMVGEVREISAFPVTREGMMTVLQNENLVQTYSATGAPYMARIDLKLDASTTSGFTWTSGQGPDQSISAGTTLSAQVTVSKKAPISLVLPFIRKHTGLGH